MSDNKKFNDSSPDAKIYRRRQSGTLMREQKAYRLIDLFSGAGGLTLGFTEAFGHGFVPIWANDFDEASVATYNANFGDHCHCGDINSLLRDNSVKIPVADVVIGGPPCQGFSLLNRQRHDDERRELWRPFFEVVKLSKAKVFVMENVPQLLGSEEHMEILEVATALGFSVASQKLCAADYGVPQARWRAFIVGSKVGDVKAVFPPRKTHFKPKNGSSIDLFDSVGEYISDPSQWNTVRSAISDLPRPVGLAIRNVPPPLDLHFGRTPTPESLLRYQVVSKEGMNRFDLQRLAPELTPQCWIRKTSGGTDLFGRLWWDRPAFTIRTEFFKPEKGRYLHPKQHRPITHREAARLQSFPDSFRFMGTKIEVAKQIGNAVPPLLAARIADCVFALLSAGKVTRERQIQPRRAKQNNGSHRKSGHCA
jgi:DNA (cytosine-5)-methyltransferase 1